ncbi:MAG: division/cell wall cluster transcriptional repressor MraZ [Bdellovibrionales bacterium]|nr:division/cell wall cluster transcriptional repressor MraZ [Bdellovibrionales bacterium]
MSELKKDAQSGSPTQVTGGFPLSFRGSFTHSIDEKGRVSLPAEFRKSLQERGEESVVITNYISEGARCLEGFALSAWVSFESKLREKSRFSSKLQRLENFYLSRSAECQLDRSGRILIPPYLRQYASVEKDVTFTSSIHGFRVWDSRVWEHIFQATEQALLEDPELFADVDI